MVVITADQCGNAMISSPSESELVSPSRRNRGRNPLEGARGGLFNSFIRKLTNGTSIEQNDRISRPTMSCISASLPNNEATLWVKWTSPFSRCLLKKSIHYLLQQDCSELEVYSLQFQPFGSLLATGSSDKVIRLWEISSTGHQHKYCTLSGSDGSINAIDFANEGVSETCLSSIRRTQLDGMLIVGSVDFGLFWCKGLPLVVWQPNSTPRVVQWSWKSDPLV